MGYCCHGPDFPQRFAFFASSILKVVLVSSGQPFRLEPRRAGDDLRHDAVGTLEGEGGEGGQRLHFRHRIHPPDDVAAGPPAPALDGCGALGGPEQQRGDRHEELVPA